MAMASRCVLKTKRPARSAPGFRSWEDIGMLRSTTNARVRLERGVRHGTHPHTRAEARHLSAACACRSSSLSASPTLSSSRHRCSHSRAAALSLSLAWQSPAKSAAFLLAFSA